MRRLIGFVFALITVATGATFASPPSTQPGDLPAGQPTWLALQGRVYQENEVDEAEKLVLPMERASFWFLAYPHAATREAFDAYVAALDKDERIKSRSSDGGHGSFQQQASGNIYWLPNKLGYPDSLAAIPADDRGVTLALTISPNGTELKFDVTLSSSARPVWREVEHRWTDIIPLLFAVYVDGQPVTAEEHGFAKMGGSKHSIELIPQGGGTRKWAIRVDEPSVRALLPDQAPHTMAIIAAFSERQRFGFQGVKILESHPFMGSNGFQPPKEHDGPQILVRSNVATINWNGNTWETRHPL